MDQATAKTRYRIIDANAATVLFETLSPGDFFLLFGDLYMKLRDKTAWGFRQRAHVPFDDHLVTPVAVVDIAFGRQDVKNQNS